MAQPRYLHGPVRVLDDMICEPVFDLKEWRSATPARYTRDSHEIVVGGCSALELAHRIVGVDGQPPEKMQIASGIQILPHYLANSPTDPEGKSAMFVGSLEFDEALGPAIVAKALIEWARSNSVQEMIVDTALIRVADDAEQAVAECERAIVVQ